TVSNALNKESPDTQAVVEQPNIIATNTNAKVTLVATGSIGDTLAEDVVIDFADGVRDLTDDEKLALSTAERSDFTIEDDKITIKQRDDVNIDVKGALAATAADQVFLGSESTVNVEDITSTHIRLKTKGDVNTAQPGEQVLTGDNVTLEAGRGGIARANE